MKKIRCAIYTRKSSEDGLEQEFNSLHAQREALSYDFPRLLCDKGAAAWHGIYAGQRRGSDRGKPGASPPRRSVIAPVFSSVLNGYPGSGPG